MTDCGLTWPGCFFARALWRCSCLPISLCTPPVSKAPPLRCPDLTRSISCSLRGFSADKKMRQGSTRGRQTEGRRGGPTRLCLPQTVDGQQHDDDEEQRYDQRGRQHVGALVGGVFWRNANVLSGGFSQTSGQWQKVSQRGYFGQKDHYFAVK